MRHLAIALLLAATPATAHEYWLEPVDYTVGLGDTIVARTINGEDFAGREWAFTPRGFQQAGIIAGNARKPITGNRGDKPAIRVRPAGPGLNVLVQALPLQSVTYPGLEKFANFLKGKRLDFALEQHAARGLPQEEIKEAYFRFVKSLVAVDGGAGSDTAVGLPFELVALDNPYTTSGDIRFRLLRRGAPVANWPAFAFVKRGGSVEKLRFRTAADGTFTVPRRRGEFMVNAVDILAPGDRVREQYGAHWQTNWASLTYAVE